MNRFTKFVTCLNTPKYCFNMCVHRVAAAVEHERVLRNLNCQTVIDIGANRGQFALVSRRCFPKAKIFSFEPLAKPAKIFHSIFDNDSRAILHQTAIGPEAGQAKIHISKRDDSSSLLPIGEMQKQLFPETGEVRTAMIPVHRLCDFISADEIITPAMLKLDVQGFELEALRGCEELLSRFSHVYAECSFVELYSAQALVDEVIRYLQQRNFALRGVHNIEYDKKGLAIQADFLFIREQAGLAHV